ncbi:VWA domain-containing protein [Bacillus sp. CGMCC 1.16541]|uniref:VWA domain-containing protein n=1 Tax=Bacillus sp. CGMCC 1.16541 TaxID=2185143 RepID=UPI000D73B47D|nr:VWA domain-containing protein [Bacillus sp. CGMCC 1.16541]
MRKKIRSLIVLFSLFLLWCSVIPVNTQATTVSGPSLNVNVVPSKTEFLKPLGSNAEGSLNITLNPQGSLDDIANQLRKPIDVVFVIDKSGSMGPQYGNKMEDAKKAMDEAVKVFSVNKLPSDRFGLVTFDSEVRDEMALTTDLTAVQNKVNQLKADGGTNYVQSFQSASKLLASSNNDKYIVFLTDGEPTEASETKPVKGNYMYCKRMLLWWCIEEITEYIEAQKVITYNANNKNNQVASFIHGNYRITYMEGNGVKSRILELGLSQAEILANQKVKLYSIGFGNNAELDMNYLKQLSDKTASPSFQANASNLSDIFRSIMTEIGQLGMKDVQLKVKIKGNGTNFPGNVQLAQNADAFMEGDYAVLNLKDVPYVLGQTAPSSSYSLPLTFSQTGTYTFSDIQLVYKDLQGKPVQKKHNSVSVTVNDKVAPTFRSNIFYTDPEKVKSLVKKGDQNGASNQFEVNYKLTPEAVLDAKDQGTLKTIKLTQPLPPGVTVINPPAGVSVKGNQLEITFNDITYGSTKFSPASLEVKLKMQANYAMNQKLQNPLLTYKDSNKGDRNQVLQAPSEFIIAKVVLEDNDVNYEGDLFGNISKVTKSNNTLIETVKLKAGNVDLTQPIQSMKFKESSDNRTITVIYSNGQTQDIFLAPAFEMFSSISGLIVPNRGSSEEKVKFRLTQKITGKDAKYEYRIDNGSWQSFDPEDEVFIDKTGTFTISVRATGGFSKKDVVISQTVTVEKLIESITVIPAQVTMFIGERETLKATISPNDATNKQLTWSIEDSSIVKNIGNNKNEEFTIEGNSLGDTNVIVQSADGKVSQTIKVTILSDFRFKYPSITMKPGEEREVLSLLEYKKKGIIGGGILNPNILDGVNTSRNTDVIEIERRQGKWYIVAKNVGYETIVATGLNSKKNGTKPTASMVIIVKQDSSSNNNSGAKW